MAHVTSGQPPRGGAPSGSISLPETAVSSPFTVFDRYRTSDVLRASSTPRLARSLRTQIASPWRLPGNVGRLVEGVPLRAALDRAGCRSGSDERARERENRRESGAHEAGGY